MAATEDTDLIIPAAVDITHLMELGMATDMAIATVIVTRIMVLEGTPATATVPEVHSDREDTVDTVVTVDTAETVDTVETADMVDTVDIVAVEAIQEVTEAIQEATAAVRVH